ncbi:vacuolar segregation subunit 7-domain-containing protein [Stachybotrys elegans]|uniref:Vacuolar segregation subunit 7-domain-containing protein n=1 Tax=Stachybotrys elegans TaxID=80388 RepID=A0A8K0T3N7_9HYPO|nr:vacuolar segregation subunit 7-domain-containing protein [Stachybotrys elegans]
MTARSAQLGALEASLPSSSTLNDSQNSKQSSANTSTNPSRDSSPVRYPRRTGSATRLAGTRSRTNSQQDMSPSRQRSSIPASTALPPSRALSSTSTPILLPATQESHIQAPTPQKPFAVVDAPRWPVSPRLRSPPPQLNKPSPIPPVRRNDSEPPSISIQRPTPSPNPSEPQQTAPESESEDLHMQSGTRTPTRGLLETVQEVSLPNSPSPADAAVLENVREKLSAENNSDTILADRQIFKPRPHMPGQESGSDSSTARIETRRPTSVPPPPAVTRQSSSLSSKQVKSKTEGSTSNMIVETETVSSVPQVPLATGIKIEGGNGTLRTKPSTETIKPKKEKRRTRKHASVNSGTASSKADFFEAKIASAVDEANTSDSEETFVYDSNPPDGTDRPGRRFHHSRTPSATSMVSQADRQNLRSIYGVMDGGGPVPPPKKNMKFVNTFNGNGADSLTGEEDGKGSGRSTAGSTRGAARQHHHIGRWGRQPGNGHASLFDNESPFQSATRPKLGSASRNSSGPPSPRIHHSARGHLSSKRSAMQMSSSYDVDDSMGADDERTPLINSARSGRSIRYSRRGPHSLRQVESQSFTRRSSYLNRFAACLVLTMMFLLVITGAIGFMFATSQPMTDIEIVSINNVVTSEQVLMFDITVKAHNPNIVVVTIDHANLEIFAKSEYAGTDMDWISDGTSDEVHLLDDPPNDPPTGGGDEDDDQKPNVLLGRITEFDSPLIFEGSLFHQGNSSSTGEMQLASPGNGTSGGTERWDRIYQNEFDLIVKGVVKYTLPLSARVRSAAVSGRTSVKPNSANDPSLQPNTTSNNVD